jgi:hypothetical protein
MDKFLKIVGIVVVAWIALSLIGWVIGAVFSGLFWIALIAGGIWAVAAISNKRKQDQVGYRRGSPAVEPDQHGRSTLTASDRRTTTAGPHRTVDAVPPFARSGPFGDRGATQPYSAGDRHAGDRHDCHRFGTGRTAAV